MNLLDIEGTTTPLSFVRDMLFPLARAWLRPFIETHGDRPDVLAIMAELRDAWHAEDRAARRPAAWPESARDAAVEYAIWLMDDDRKLTPLKALQGLIWEEAYRAGQIMAPVYEDVAPALTRWAARGCPASIFSSGSVLAQRSLFSHTTAGDLTPLLGPLFDTTIGSKCDAASYASIASYLHANPSEICFVSDIVAELDAARATGMDTALCVREEHIAEVANEHRVVRSLAELELLPRR